MALAGCLALGCLALTDANRVPLQLAGAGVAVIAAMRQHEGDAGVTKAGCSALRNLAVIPESKEPLRLAGAGEVIIAALELLV